jgi:hypothetical protein
MRHLREKMNFLFNDVALGILGSSNSILKLYDMRGQVNLLFIQQKNRC